MTNKYFATVKTLLLYILIIISSTVYSQINAYAKVTAIAGNTLSLSNVNQVNHTFANGEQIIVMQMQDNVLDTATNVNGFGDLSGTGLSVGKYEIATINTLTGSPTPTSLTLVSALNNTYDIGANASVQIISFQLLGTPNYTAPAISAVAWNGSVGGVVAIQVNGTLTMTGNITADGVGFRGGSVSANYYPGGNTCDTIYNTWISNSTNRGAKGESIFLRTNSVQANGKSHILNGGGGGVNINVGGGGGSNYSAGGHSGPGWSGDSINGCYNNALGESQGGLALGPSRFNIVSAFRVFMGGGGGGGQQNDGVGTSGAAGGGIVLIEATTITTTGACGGYRISANGANATNTTGGGNDGGGGGGGAGSIVLNVGTFTIAPGCHITINANGGNGANVNYGATHSGGGGGGVGAIVFSSAQPTTNVTTTTTPGAGGLNSDLAGATSAQSGSTGNGVIANVTTPLPIQLVSFTGQSEGDYNKLEWITMSETNNDYFTLYHSPDAINFTSIATVKGAGNSDWQINYTTNDYQPYVGVTYYRLKQTDYDGKDTYSPTIAIANGLDNVSVDNVYPNPTTGSLNFDFHAPINGQIHIQIFSYLGQLVLDNIQNVNEGRNAVSSNIEAFAKGIYTIRIIFEQTNYIFTTKVIKE